MIYWDRDLSAAKKWWRHWSGEGGTGVCWGDLMGARLLVELFQEALLDFDAAGEFFLTYD